MVFAQANSDAPILRAYALEQQDQPPMLLLSFDRL
jgi:hypothetical protein